jgi:hypothetical protein
MTMILITVSYAALNFRSSTADTIVGLVAVWCAILVLQKLLRFGMKNVDGQGTL